MKRFTSCWHIGALLIGLATASYLYADPHIIDAKDKDGEVFREAARVLIVAIQENNEKTYLESFAGEGDELKLLKSAVDVNNSTKQFNATVKSQFPNAPAQFDQDFAAAELRIIKIATIITNDRKPDEASMSPGGGLPFDGYKFKKTRDKWLVSSITVFTENVPSMIDANLRIKSVFDDLSKNAKAGQYKTTDELLNALKQSFQPVFKDYQEKIAEIRSKQPSTEVKGPSQK